MGQPALSYNLGCIKRGRSYVESGIFFLARKCLIYVYTNILCTGTWRVGCVREAGDILPACGSQQQYAATLEGVVLMS